jgi:hypothetical protein
MGKLTKSLKEEMEETLYALLFVVNRNYTVTVMKYHVNLTT